MIAAEAFNADLDGEWQLKNERQRINETVYFFRVFDPKRPTVAEYDYSVGFGIDATSTATLNPEYVAAMETYRAITPRTFIFGIKTGGKHGHIYGYRRVQDYYVPVLDLGIIGGTASPFDTNFNTRDFNISFGTFLASIVTMGYASAAAGVAATAAAQAGEAYTMTLGQTLSMLSQANAAVGGGLTNSFLGENARYVPLAKIAVQVIA